MSNVVKNIIIHNDDITEQKRDQMNCLYRTCVYVLKAHFAFEDHGSWFNLKQLQSQLNVLHQLLTVINKGNDPVDRDVDISAVMNTTYMLERIKQ